VIRTRRFVLSAASCIALLAALPAAAQAFVTVASTTSTGNSGLSGHILPLFTAETGIVVRVVSQGTGQALETGRRGDADVVFVHARAAEERFVAEGHGVQRFDVICNRLVLVGPGDDPAAARSAGSAAAAMAAIARVGAPFASRGDDSGTRAAEKTLRAAAGGEPAGSRYLSTGSGMGATLNTAAQIPACARTDRGTWLSFANRRPLGIVFAGGPRPVQSPWPHPGEPGAPPACEGRAGAGLHRLDDLRRGSGGHRQLCGGGRATVRPRRTRGHRGAGQARPRGATLAAWCDA
jgi:tungstate transport system substrate-binding protein